jgi:hypothetical protein
MRKIVIITAVMILSVGSTFCVCNATYKANITTLKVSKTVVISANTLIAGKTDFATAD